MKKPKDINKTVDETLADLLDIKEDFIKAESTITEDLGGDSLDEVEIVLALEEEFGIHISDDESSKLRKVDDCYTLIRHKLEEKTNG